MDDAPDPTPGSALTNNADDRELTPGHTRTASALASVVIGMAAALLMLVFVVQNGQRVTFELLWIDFTLAAGVALLVSAIAGGLIVATLGIGRVVQLRLAARRHRSSEHLFDTP